MEQSRIKDRPHDRMCLLASALSIIVNPENPKQVFRVDEVIQYREEPIKVPDITTEGLTSLNLNLHGYGLIAELTRQGHLKVQTSGVIPPHMG